MHLRLVTRAACAPCELAQVALRALGIEFDIVDVDGTPGLADQYGARVPVLLGDGRILAEGHIDQAVLLSALGRPR